MRTAPGSSVYEFKTRATSCDLYLRMPWNAEDSRSSEELSLFVIRQPNACWPDAGWFRTNDTPAREHFMNVGVVLFRSLRATMSRFSLKWRAGVLR